MNKDVRVFSYQPFKDSVSPELYQQLKDKFIKYKKTGITPEDFGRDVPFDFPAKLRDSGLIHIHIKDKSSKKWKLKKFSYNKTSNTALIYAVNYFNPNVFLLIGLLDNAHQVYEENLLYLLELSDIADRFVNKNF